MADTNHGVSEIREAPIAIGASSLYINFLLVLLSE